MNLSCIITITTDVRVQVKDNDTYHTVKFFGHLQREFFIVLVHTPVHDMSLCKSIYCYIESCTVHQFYLIFTQYYLTFSQIRHKFTNFSSLNCQPLVFGGLSLETSSLYARVILKFF